MDARPQVKPRGIPGNSPPSPRYNVHHGGNGEAVKGGGAMVEVLSEMQTLLEANEKLQNVLQYNSVMMEKKIELVKQLKSQLQAKSAELDRVRKQHGDTRVSVLGFKARIMKLTGDLEQMRGARGSSDVQQLGEQLRKVQLEKEEIERSNQTHVASLQASIDQLEQQVQHLSSATQGWSVRSEMVEREKRDMVSEYRGLLMQKDDELKELEALGNKLKQELIEKQTMIDSLQHRPVPKPRTHTVVDPQALQQITELNQQLSEARQQLQRERNFRETSEQRNRDLRSKLEKMTEDSISSTSRLQTAESEIAQMRRERKTINDEIIKLQRELQQQREVRQKEAEPESTGQGGKAAPRGSLISKMNKLTRDKQLLEDRVAALAQEKSQLEDELQLKDLHLRQLSDDQSQHIQHYQERLSQAEEELQESRTSEEELEKIKRELEARLCEFEENIRIMTDMSTNKDEKIHNLETQLSQTLSNLKKKDVNQSHWDTLMQQFQDQSQIVSAQMEQWKMKNQQLQSQVNQLEQEKRHLREQLDKKQKDCQEYLDTSKLWREQFEQAKSDFEVERRQRERDVQVVAQVRNKKTELEADIGRLMRNSNIQEQHIATLEALLAEANIQIPPPPVDSGQFTGELHRVPRYNQPPFDPGFGQQAPAGGRGNESTDGFQQPIQPPMPDFGSPRPPRHVTRTDTRPAQPDPFQHPQPHFHTQFDPEPPGSEGRQQFPYPSPAPPPAPSPHVIHVLPKQLPQPFAGEPENTAPVDPCPICGRNDFPNQTALVQHSAQCTDFLQ